MFAYCRLKRHMKQAVNYGTKIVLVVMMLCLERVFNYSRKFASPLSNINSIPVVWFEAFWN